jgi:hypothetical protein
VQCSSHAKCTVLAIKHDTSAAYRNHISCDIYINILNTLQNFIIYPLHKKGNTSYGAWTAHIQSIAFPTTCVQPTQNTWHFIKCRVHTAGSPHAVCTVLAIKHDSSHDTRAVYKAWNFTWYTYSATELCNIQVACTVYAMRNRLHVRTLYPT